MPEATDPLRREIKIIDGDSGAKVLGSFRVEVKSRDAHAGCDLDPTGKLLALSIPYKNGWMTNLFEMPSVRWLKPLSAFTGTPNVGATLWTGEPHFSIYRDLDKPPLVTLDLDALMTCNASFNAKGTHVVRGNKDGTVTVCDINDVLRRLAEIGLN